MLHSSLSTISICVTPRSNSFISSCRLMSIHYNIFTQRKKYACIKYYIHILISYKLKRYIYMICIFLCSIYIHIYLYVQADHSHHIRSSQLTSEQILVNFFLIIFHCRKYMCLLNWWQSFTRFCNALTWKHTLIVAQIFPLCLCVCNWCVSLAAKAITCRTNGY